MSRVVALVAALLLAGPGCLLSPTREREQGRQAAEQVEAWLGLVEDPALVDYLRGVGARLAEQSSRQDVAYRFSIVNRPEPNAFALPGGHIYVSRGMLVLLNTEDELANVLAHEIGHIAARHHLKSQVRRWAVLPLDIVSGLGAFATSVVSPQLGSTLGGFTALPGALALASYSRGQEREADQLGQQIAASAGWSPAGMASAMDALTREAGLRGEQARRESFLDSHPTSPERSADAARRAQSLERAPLDPISPSPRAFLERLDGLLVGESAAEGVFDGVRFLHPDLGFALSFPDQWETHNSPILVAARSAEGDFAALQLAGPGDDPLATAKAFIEEGVPLVSGPQPTRVGDLSAAHAVARAPEQSLADLTWIASGGSVYLIAGVAAEARFEALRPLLRAVAQSFAPITALERARVREARLRVVALREGETLEELLSRVGSTWSAEEASSVNALQAGNRAAAGRQLKIALPEPYPGVSARP